MPLEKELSTIEIYLSRSEQQNSNVSAVSIGWHIDHSLKVILKTCEAVKKSNPREYRWNFSLTRFLVFTLKSFPRGRANAPKSVMADGEITENDLNPENSFEFSAQWV